MTSIEFSFLSWALVPLDPPTITIDFVLTEIKNDNYVKHKEPKIFEFDIQIKLTEIAKIEQIKTMNQFSPFQANFMSTS